MTEEALRVLVVDDTVTYRKIASEAVNGLGFAEAAATAPRGDIALKKLACGRYDVVLLDVEMPGLGGVETLIQIKRDFPRVEVVMFSGATEKSAGVTIKAMQAGALGLLRKPAGKDADANLAELRQDLEGVLEAVWQKQRMGGAPRPAAPPTRPARPAAVPTRFAVMAVGVSTGGPKALTHFIPALKADFPLPVVLVQHMPPPFTAALAHDLDGKSALEVREAAEGDQVRAGRVLIAPGGRHMVLRETDEGIVAGLNDGPKENSCRPAVDVLFRSVAACYGSRGVLAVIMTGMGSDGLRGVQSLKRKGCYCLSQSERSCVVYGMPQAVDEAGLSDERVDLDELAARATALAMRENRG